MLKHIQCSLDNSLKNCGKITKASNESIKRQKKKPYKIKNNSSSAYANTRTLGTYQKISEKIVIWTEFLL